MAQLDDALLKKFDDELAKNHSQGSVHSNHSTTPGGTLKHINTFAMGADTRGNKGAAMNRLEGDADEGEVHLAKKNKLAAMRTFKSFALGMTEDDYDKRWEPETDNHDEMPLSGLIINMASDLMPAGMLPLANGFSNSRVGWVGAVLCVPLFYLLSAHMMIMVAKTATYENVQSKGLVLTYRGMWQVIVGKGSWVPPVAVTLVCYGNCVAYSCFFAQLLTGALPGVGIKDRLLSGAIHSLGLKENRTVVLVVISIFPLLKLCMLRDLSSLAPSSAAGVVMVIYTTIFMVVRAVDGTYLPGGSLYETDPTPLQPDISEDAIMRMGDAPLLLVNALALAYLTHYNGMKYFRELENHTVARFSFGVKTAMGIAAFIYVVTMLLGYYTFGDDACGVILDNYNNEDDIGATIGRIGMGFSIVFSYPLMFSGLREAFVSTLKDVIPSKKDTFDTIRFQNWVTVAMLTSITLIAIKVEDPSVVVGIVGSLLGSSCIYVLPALLFVKACEEEDVSSYVWEVRFAKVMFVFGIVLGVYGCITVLQNS